MHTTGTALQSFWRRLDASSGKGFAQKSECFTNRVTFVTQIRRDASNRNSGELRYNSLNRNRSYAWRPATLRVYFGFVREGAMPSSTPRFPQALIRLGRLTLHDRPTPLTKIDTILVEENHADAQNSSKKPQTFSPPGGQIL